MSLLLKNGGGKVGRPEGNGSSVSELTEKA
jgi:hypothetical protein